LAPAIGVALCVASSPAFAHGIEGVVAFLVTLGGGVGFVGGVAASLLPYRPLRKAVVGLLASEALLFVLGLVYTIIYMSPSRHPVEDVGAMALWLAMFAAPPLAVAFLAALVLASLFRSHVWPGKRRRETAP